MTARAFVFDAYGTLFDVQSVATATEAAFPGMGALVTQVWRLKQLEYTWLRSLMGEWRDFGIVTEEALRFTLDALGLRHDPALVARIAGLYLALEPYADARPTLEALAGRPRAILSNGSGPMLDAMIEAAGFGDLVDAVLSVDAVEVSKPAMAVYALVEERLGVAPRDTVFVSGNPFDVAGAKRFGFKVAWIERVTQPALAAEIGDGSAVAAATLFKILRNRPEAFGYEADWRLACLADLAALDL